VPVQNIGQEFCSTQTLQNCGMCDGSVYQLLSCLGHHLKISKGVVYPLQNNQPIHRPKLGESAIYCQKSSDSNSETYRFLCAGCKNYSSLHSEQNCAMEEEVLKWEISNEDDADIAEAVYSQLGTRNVVWNTEEKNEEGM